MSDTEIPALIDEWGTRIGNPLDLAQRIIGFPVPVNTRAGSSSLSMSVSLSGPFPPDQPWNWTWTYDSIDPANGNDGDPAAMFGPALSNLDWVAAGSSPSGSSTFEHAPPIPLGEVAASGGPFTITTLNDVSELDPSAIGTGLSFTVALTAQNNYIPVPMLSTLFDEVPVAPGARLVELTLESHTRADGSRYLDLTYICYLFDNSAEAAKDTYSTGLAGSPYQAGRISTSNPGTIDSASAEMIDGVWTEPVVVLDRYPGVITVESDPATGHVESTVKMTLDPGSPALTPPGE